MILGFIRSNNSADDLQEEIAALEGAGCERVVVEAGDGRTTEMFRSLTRRLTAGDCIVVSTLTSVASSMPELISLATELRSRDVRLRSLKDGFDTHGPDSAALKAVLWQLQQFEQQLEVRRQQLAVVQRSKRIGRPRALTDDQIRRARRQLAEGRKVDEIAREMHVSRATLYRCLPLDDDGYA